jgi:hypothetical protein
MKLKPGCGCLLILLAVVNLVLFLSAILSIVRGPSENPVQPSNLLLVGSALIFAANVAVSMMLGLAAFRGVSFGRKGPPQEAYESTDQESTAVAEEGADEGED